jgi:hypothetical protein
MAQNFISFTTQLGTAASTISTANSTDAVIGIRATNILATTVTLNVWIVPNGTANIRYICNTLSIPPYSSVELVQGGAKFVLNSGDALKANSSDNTSIDLITSIVDAISTAP